MKKIAYLVFLLAFWPSQSNAQIATRLQECNTGSLLATCALTAVGANHTLVAIQDCLNSCQSFNTNPPMEAFGLTWTRGVFANCFASVVGAQIDYQNIWYAQTGAHTGNLTVTISAATGSRFIWVREYSANLIEDTSNCTSSTIPPADSGPLVTTVASDLFVTLFYGTGFTSPTNFTLCCADSGAGFFGGDATVGAPGTYDVTGTTTSRWLMNVLAFKLGTVTSHVKHKAVVI